MAKFYDIHMHAMNLNHASLLAFLCRGEEQGLIGKIGDFGKFLLNLPKELPAAIEAALGYKRVINLLAMMENSLGDFFGVMEQCLRENSIVSDQNVIKIAALGSSTIPPAEYQRIVLTPLVIDFEWMNYLKGFDVHYQKAHSPAAKNEDQQIVDLLKGIRDYAGSCRNKGIQPLFEIYPFLGINPGSTRFKTPQDIVNYLDIYFKNYSGKETDFEQAFQNIGDLDLDGEDIAIGDSRFAGVKLYPPTGFDPWPADSGGLEKVRALYEYCADRVIPITIHCSTGGFICGSRDDARKRADPIRWHAILDTYVDLKVNFAHMGGDDGNWRQEIGKLILKYPGRVYTDFSSVACDANYYKTISSFLGLGGPIEDFVMFGTDFMINLLDIDSYNLCYKQFLETTEIGGRSKRKFGSINPQKFLFVP